MKLTWYGHSCFLLENASGGRLVCDPCDPGTGYVLSGIACDAVTVSHHHHDHDHLAALSGDPVVIDTTEQQTVAGFSIRGVETFHDEKRGALRGNNVMFCIEADGITLVHAGDLGHVPNERTIGELGSVDVLLLPVGGVYTVDADGARETVERLHPRVVIPMHYETDALTFKLDPVTRFTERIGGRIVKTVQSDTVDTDELLADTAGVVVMEYRK